MVQKIPTPAKVRRFGECVEDVVPRNEHSFGHPGIRTGWAKDYSRNSTPRWGTKTANIMSQTALESWLLHSTDMKEKKYQLPDRKRPGMLYQLSYEATASYRHRGSQDFESLSSPDCFFRLLLLKLENLLWCSFFTFIDIRSTNMNYFIYSSHHCLYLLHIYWASVLSFKLWRQLQSEMYWCTEQLAFNFFLALVNVYVSSSQSE